MFYVQDYRGAFGDLCNPPRSIRPAFGPGLLSTPPPSQRAQFDGENAPTTILHRIFRSPVAAERSLLAVRYVQRGPPLWSGFALCSAKLLFVHNCTAQVLAIGDSGAWSEFIHQLIRNGTLV